jgi:hypothetical protein
VMRLTEEICSCVAHEVFGTIVFGARTPRGCLGLTAAQLTIVELLSLCTGEADVVVDVVVTAVVATLQTAVATEGCVSKAYWRSQM